MTRGHRIGGHLDAKAEIEQFEGSLGHADVGLDPDDGDMADITAVELFQELGDGTAMKGQLAGTIRDQVGHFGGAGT